MGGWGWGFTAESAAELCFRLFTAGTRIPLGVNKYSRAMLSGGEKHLYTLMQMYIATSGVFLHNCIIDDRHVIYSFGKQHNNMTVILYNFSVKYQRNENCLAQTHILYHVTADSMFVLTKAPSHFCW